MPVDITSLYITTTVIGEPIRRVAVRVLPRVRRGSNGAKQKRRVRRTIATLLLVLVLVERPLRSAVKARKRKTERIAPAAAPFAREVPRLDLLEAPFLRAWAFFEAFAGRSVGRERHVTERIGARVARPDPVFRERPDTTKTRTK